MVPVKIQDVVYICCKLIGIFGHFYATLPNVLEYYTYVISTCMFLSKCTHWKLLVYRPTYLIEQVEQAHKIFLQVADDLYCDL